MLGELQLDGEALPIVVARQPPRGRSQPVYPEERILVEVGRVAIAAGRLDAELGALWWHLAADRVSDLDARRAPASKVRRKIIALAEERLDDIHRAALTAYVDEVHDAQRQRNEVLHSRWLLRGRDALRPVSEFFGLAEEDRAEYLTAWEREARASDEWQRQPNDSLALVDPHRIDELIRVERRLAKAAEVAVQWQFRIASMRETGSPTGWRGPTQMRTAEPSEPSDAVVGPAAEALLPRFVQRSGHQPEA